MAVSTARVDALKVNLALLYGAEILSKGLGLAVFGYLGRILTQSRYGDLEFAVAILFLLNLFLEAGLAPYAAREASREPWRMHALASQVAAIRAVLLGCALLIVVGTAWTLDRDPIATRLILLYGLVLVPVPLLLNWAFQARDEMVIVAASSTIRQVVLATVAFTMVRQPADVIWVPVGDALGLLTAVSFQQVLFWRRAGHWRPWQHLAGLGRAVRESLPIATSSIVWAIRMFFPVIALGLFTDAAQTGVFGAGHRLIVALHTFVWLYFFNLLPSLARVARRDDLTEYRTLIRSSFLLVAWVVLAGASLGAVLSSWLIPLVYGEGLSSAAEPFGIMLWALVAAFLSGHQRFSLIALNRQGRELAAGLVGGVVSVGACLLLSSHLTPELAAYIFITSEATTFAVAASMVRLHVGTLHLAKVLRLPVVAAAIAFAGRSVFGLDVWPATTLTVFVFLAVVAVDGRHVRRAVTDLRVARLVEPIGSA